jgi:hypothetical protein
MDEQQAKFEGWAVVEIIGHNREIGYVRTEYFGPVGLFRIDRPEIPEREYELKRPGYAATLSGGTEWAPAGSKVRRGSLPAKSALVGPSAIFRITPCTELMAMEAIEEMLSAPLIVLSLPERAQIEAGQHDDPEDNPF